MEIYKTYPIIDKDKFQNEFIGPTKVLITHKKFKTSRVLSIIRLLKGR